MSENSQNVKTFTAGNYAQAVRRNGIPAIIAMLFVLVYNLADTFFISLTNNDLMIAAVSICTPLFLIFMSLGTLFGIGGTSMISRALGEGKKEYATKICSFSFWACIGTGALCTILLLVFMEPILHLLGASEKTIGYARTYLVSRDLLDVSELLRQYYSRRRKT